MTCPVLFRPIPSAPRAVKYAIIYAVVCAAVALSLSACGSSGPALTPLASGSDGQSVSSNLNLAQSTPTAVSAALVSEADAAQQVLVNVYQRVNSSVVNIDITNTDSTQPDSSGSGFVIDTNGHIVTNAHVVQNAASILVTFADGYTASGKMVGADNYSDLAVIQVTVDKSHLSPVPLGDSSGLEVGQRIVVIGNPFGLLSSMSTGIISATGRTLQSAAMLDPQSVANYSNPSIIQVDAQINPGNSGGPLLDLNGTVIGVAAAIRTQSGVFEGVGFAIPINTAKRIIPQLISSGKVQYSWLGIESISGVNGLNVAALAEPLKLPVNHGILISKVLDGSPASDAGLHGGGGQSVNIRSIDVPTGGDIIVAVNGQSLRDMDELLSYLVDNTAPGDKITLTIVRDGQTFDVPVALKARPGAEGD